MWREKAGDADFAGNFWPMAAGDQVALFRPTVALHRGVLVQSYFDVAVCSALQYVYYIQFFRYYQFKIAEAFFGRF